jgi:hypothetical protein
MLIARAGGPSFQEVLHPASSVPTADAVHHHDPMRRRCTYSCFFAPLKRAKLGILFVPFFSARQCLLWSRNVPLYGLVKAFEVVSLVDGIESGR